MVVPADLKYSEEHIWVKLEGGHARIGLTDFAQSELGDIVFVELPKIGEQLAAGEPFGSVESVKSVTELYAPVSGTVMAVNEALVENPGTLNLTPYTDSWMVKIELSHPDEADNLWEAERYELTYSLDE
jgi:glycine cleavage system H protein